MVQKTRWAVIATLALFVAQSANALTTAPEQTTRQLPEPGQQMAQSCLPRLSPQMAAALGLPVLTLAIPACAQG